MQSTGINSILSVSLLVVLLSIVFTFVFPYHISVLRELSIDQFAWSASTTTVPISTVSVHAKALLSRDVSALPHFLHDLIPSNDDPDTLLLQPVRDRLNARRFQHLQNVCQNTPWGVYIPWLASFLPSSCNYNEQHKEFGLTPLHLADAVHDYKLANYLRTNSARSVNDHVGREPKNLSFVHFIQNAKNAARARDDKECDLPVVDYNGNDILWAQKETRRIVSEGEPVLLRGAYTKYAEHEEWNVKKFISQHGSVPVTVGSVPYAGYFNLSTSRMTLSEFYTRFMSTPSSSSETTGTAKQNVYYVFNKNGSVCQDAYDVILRLLNDAFPMKDGLFVHPDKTGGVDEVHYFFGPKDSGAPFHIHADAVNAAVSGRKKWYLHTPARTIYSRKPIKDWVTENLPSLAEEDRPLECVQRPGDVVYVPLDWGHAVHNLDDDTFGVALELLNRRDTLAHITGHA